MEKDTVFDIVHQMDIFTNNVMIKWNKKFNENLGVSHVLTLNYINNNQNARPSEIARELGLTPPTVTILVNKLVKKELVVRQLDDSDRRIITLVITDKGKETLVRASSVGHELRRELFTKLTEQEKEQLSIIYKKLNS